MILTVSYALLLEVMVEVGNIDMITEVMVHVERYQISYISFSVSVSILLSVPLSASISLFLFLLRLLFLFCFK